MKTTFLIIDTLKRHFTPEGRKWAISFLRKNKGELLKDLPDIVEIKGCKKTLQSKLKKPAESIRSIIDCVIERIKKEGVERKPGTAMNIKTKVQEPITIVANPSQIEVMNIDGKRIGLANLKYDNNYPWIPEAERSLYLDYIATSPEYKGVGSEMMREIVHMSKNQGFNGNVSLLACTGSVPSEFMQVCGYGKCCGPEAVSAAIKYSKMGFVSQVEGLQEKINAEIANGGNGLRRGNSAYHGLKDILSGPMDLSKEAIQKYLSVPSVVK